MNRIRSRLVNPFDAVHSTVVSKGTYLLLALALMGVLLSLLAYPAFAQTEQGDEDRLLWSADLSIVELEGLSIGAISADDFSNQGGNAGLRGRWLYYSLIDENLRLKLTDTIPSHEVLTLQVGDLAIEFEGGTSTYTWRVDAVDWEDGQTIAARIVIGANTPATGLPTITGTAEAGQTLTANTTGISDADGMDNATFTYQWLADDADIQDATASTHSLTLDDVGKTIKVRVSFTDDRNNSEVLTSAATAAVAPRPNNPATGLPTITGTAEAGQTLTANTTGISDADGMDNATFTYQWLADDADIQDATASTHSLTLDDVGKTIKVRVSFTDDRNNSEVLTSAATAAVAPRPNNPATGLPTITGTAQAGQTLTADTSGIADADGLTNAAFSYQWLADDADIQDATGSTYVVSDDDVGKTIKVRVSFTDDWNNAESLTSAATAAVTARPPNNPATGLPTISGTAQAGQTLTADTSDITDANGLANVSYTYQWLADDADIQDATGSTYVVSDDDVGKTIKVRVSFTDDRNNSEVLTSAATAAVAPRPINPATGVLTISGTAQAGQTLTADTSDITDADGLTNATFTYQWLADDADIQDATGSTYVVSDDDVGKTIKVRVSFTDDALNEETLTSAATTAVVAAVPTEPLSLTVSEGSQDQELVASWEVPSSNGGSTITGYKVQWKEATGSWDSAADVSEETVTGTLHTITGLTGGVEYAVRVIATNDAGDGPASSEATGTPAGDSESENNPPTGAPTITGTARVGETLTAVTSGIADADGLSDVSYAYQWIRTTAGTDADIADATGSTYTLTGDDEGTTIKVQVAFDDDNGNSETLTSASTAAVGQGSQVLVSNLGVGVSGAGGIQRALHAARPGFAQAFTTGADTEGYALGSIGVQVSHFQDGWTVGDHLRVTINGAASAGGPGGAHCTLSNPSSFPAPGVIVFTAPAGASSCPQLTKETTYFVVIEWVDPGGTDSFALIPQTYPTEEEAARGEDPGGAEGWSIADRAHYLTVSPGPPTWVAFDETASFKIRVQEAGIPAGTGVLTISGTVQEGETLTADITAIADPDGLTNASYRYQWLADDTDVEGATGPTYELTGADVGKTIRVRVSFTDDAGNEETLTSAATAAVAAALAPLTVALENNPVSHDGSAEFTFEIRFSEHIAELSYVTLKEHAFTETGGTVERAKRLEPDSDTPNLLWRITVRPAGNGT